MANAFKHSDPDLTKVFNELYKECPSLFQQILPRSEVADYASLLDDDDDEDLGQLDLTSTLAAGSFQDRPAAIACIPPKYAKETLGLPIRPTQMSDSFQKMYTNAFEAGYSKKFVTEFGKNVLR